MIFVNENVDETKHNVVVDRGSWGAGSWKGKVEMKVI